MSNTIKNVLIFSLGAATGSLVAWRLLKTKYEQLAQNEIDAYKEYVRTKKEPVGEDEKQATDEKPEEVVEETEHGVPTELLNRYRSNDYTKEENTVRAPYVISPDEYGTVEGFQCRSLTYYADGVLTDDWDEVIHNPDDVVGEDFASHFGEYEDDSVFVRNEGDECDYEILRDLNTYADTISPPDHIESEA